MILGPTLPIWKKSHKTLFLLLFVPLFVSCATREPIYPVGVIPPAKPPTPSEEKYGHEVLEELTQKAPLDYSNPRMGEVQRVVDRLAKAANATGSPWQVYLLKDPTTKNAAATRGNHLFVWSGMLDFAKDEEELAAILAHEMSHVLAGHTGPDPSDDIKKLLISIGGIVAGTAASIAVGPQAGNIVGQLANDSTVQLGSAAIIYPNSRAKELEADRIGIFLMADAGYDPNAAIRLWTRAQTDPTFRSIPFLSTHPGAEERLIQLKSLAAQATERYKNPGKRPSPASNAIVTNSSTPSSPTPAAASIPLDSSQDSFLALDSVTTNSDCKSKLTVTSEKAVLYAKTDRNSKALGEFRRGSTICSAGNKGGWVRVYEPDSGYISASDLAKE